MKKKHNKLNERIKNLFYFLVANFVFLLLEMFTPFSRKFLGSGGAYLLPFLTYSLGGFWMVYLLKNNGVGELTKYLKIVGLSAGFTFVAVLLHNLVTAIGIYATGNWAFDEGFFFLLAVIVLPILFIFSSVKIFLLMFKK